MEKKYKSLKDHVYDHIANQLSEGRLKPGDKLNESGISTELGISRTPVREALIQLGSEGIIDVVPRKGFYIIQLTNSEAVKIYQVIGNLDGLAAKLACPSLTDADFNEMQYFIDSMTLSIKSKKYKIYVEQQHDFHNIYISKCHNEILINTINRLEKKFIQRSYKDTDTLSMQQNLYDTNLEHTTIMNLLQEGKSEEVEMFIKKVHWNIANAHFDTMEGD